MSEKSHADMTHVPYLDLACVNARYQPQLSARLEEVIASGWYLGGVALRSFEQAFATYTETTYCVGVANGLDALTLILMAYKRIEGWADGDEVIVPAFTFVATADAVVRAGLCPVFCDVGDDFLIDCEQLGACFTPRTRVVVPVHLYGAPCDMHRLVACAQAHGCKVVEDAAQAHGAVYANRKVGCWGDAAAFSFYPGKNLGALGDGGAVCTNDESLAEQVRMLANYGSRTKYCHEAIGVNSRLDDIQAATLSVKLQSLDDDNALRRKWARVYNETIDCDSIVKPYGGRVEHSVFHVYPILTEHRDALAQHLQDAGICCLTHYPLPVPHQPSYRTYHRMSFPRSERFARQELSLPLYQGIPEQHIAYIIDQINQFQP